MGDINNFGCHNSQVEVGGEGVTTNICWVVTRDAATQPTQQGIIWPQMSIVLMWRIPVLSASSSHRMSRHTQNGWYTFQLLESLQNATWVYPGI